MPIEKLPEFAKDGQKNTDELDLETGFIVNRKPARQWFNWLFNTLALKINDVIDKKLDSDANAASATKLATARSIGGVNFDGTANINLPGVNTAGNQDTTGNAATATKLATARTIGGVPFDGTANINLPLLGYSQTYQDVKASRVNNTYYTNTSGKPITVFMAIHDTNGSGFGFEVGGYTWNLGWDLPAYMYYPMSFIVPNGISYKVFWAGTASELLFWTELR